MDTRNSFGFFDTFHVNLYVGLRGYSYCAIIKRGVDIIATATADTKREALYRAVTGVRRARRARPRKG